MSDSLFVLSDLIKVPLYPIRICVIASDDSGLVDKHLRENGCNTDARGDVHASTYQGGYALEEDDTGWIRWACIYVVLNPGHNEIDPMTPGVIAHESLHVVEAIYDFIGQEDKNFDESTAYLLQFVVDSIHKFMDSIPGS